MQIHELLSALPAASRAKATLFLYVDQCASVWRQQGLSSGMALVIVEHTDFAGSLVLSLLEARPGTRRVQQDALTRMVVASRTTVGEVIDIAFGSLSLEFSAPPIHRLFDSACPLMVFAGAGVEIMDLEAIMERRGHVVSEPVR